MKSALRKSLRRRSERGAKTEQKNKRKKGKNRLPRWSPRGFRKNMCKRLSKGRPGASADPSPPLSLTFPRFPSVSPIFKFRVEIAPRFSGRLFFRRRSVSEALRRHFLCFPGLCTPYVLKKTPKIMENRLKLSKNLWKLLPNRLKTQHENLQRLRSLFL